jgi:hypothetical protein
MPFSLVCLFCAELPITLLSLLVILWGCVKRSKFQTRPLFLFNFIFFLYLGVAALRWVKWRAATVYLGHFQVKKSV